ncbi:hypothetical protein ASPCAL05759 [Aspergillus calidoustus]|uniref:F-box domain protein n=1 Tax=Aspergillus calidoustus TaxID=454130 RepID=A0A0U5FZ54_ASPCI|nr:hypothetical protein ASPCAL05759 [Aspergillus calidoustus]
MIATVLNTVKSPRLNLVAEWDHAAPESSFHSKALHDFFVSFHMTWLKPYSSIQHLTLSCDQRIGFLPYLDLTDVHFPRLKRLILNKFTFAVGSHLTWIISHASILTALYLDECSILYDVGIYEDYLSNVPFSKSEME